ASGAALEQRGDDHHAVLLRQRAQALGAGAGDRLGQVEFANRLVLAEIGAVVQLLQQHQAGTLGGSLRHARLDDGQVGLGIAVVAFLDQGDGKDRKSTRLNSSHVKISYAVFCLKKKKITNMLEIDIHT